MSRLPTPRLKRRPLGNTDMSVSEVGLGAWQLGNPDWGMRDDTEGLNIISAALEAGCNFFDTAPAYGAGRSEELLGKVLAPVRDRVVICTKFCNYGPNGKDFSIETLRPQLEESLRRLQTDYVDVLLIHNPPRELMNGNHTPHYELMDRLKEEGKLRAYGVSLDWRTELDMVVNTTGSTAIEVMFNAFYQEPKAAFARARQRGVGLIVKVPLDSGWLAGRYRADSTFSDVRKRWSPEAIQRRGALVERLAALLPPGTSMVHAALRYVLAQPEVSSVIPGAKSLEQLHTNLSASNAALPIETVQAIEALWADSIAGDPLPW